jgi:hypothetical protein
VYLCVGQYAGSAGEDPQIVHFCSAWQSSSAGSPLLVAIYYHARTVGTGRGFLVIAGIALAFLMIPSS